MKPGKAAEKEVIGHIPPWSQSHEYHFTLGQRCAKDKWDLVNIREFFVERKNADRVSFLSPPQALSSDTTPSQSFPGPPIPHINLKKDVPYPSNIFSPIRSIPQPQTPLAHTSRPSASRGIHFQVTYASTPTRATRSAHRLQNSPSTCPFYI